MNGIYDSVLDDILSNPTAHLEWLKKEKINPSGWDHHSIYASNAEVNHANFPNVLYQSYLNKIRFGLPWSGNSEVDNAIAYNARQTDFRKKLTHLVSEIEDYTGTTTPAQFQVLLETNYPKAKAANLPFGVYNGWSEQYSMIVENSDFLLLHAYTPSSRYTSTAYPTGKQDGLYGYVAGYDETTKTFNVRRKNGALIPGRLPSYASAGKALNKIVNVSILYSAETAYGGGGYYQNHGWVDGHTLFMDSYNRLATPEMKQWLVISGCYMFSAKFMKAIKP